ncbi:hypothetical protein C8R43DRAFT_949351 [Mycena crocata]|nr:hypothetical protein C8R43DRAFT_949351 [Mycena crocata]
MARDSLADTTNINIPVVATVQFNNEYSDHSEGADTASNNDAQTGTVAKVNGCLYTNNNKRYENNQSDTRKQVISQAEVVNNQIEEPERSPSKPLTRITGPRTGSTHTGPRKMDLVNTCISKMSRRNGSTLLLNGQSGENHPYDAADREKGAATNHKPYLRRHKQIYGNLNTATIPEISESNDLNAKRLQPEHSEGGDRLQTATNRDGYSPRTKDTTPPNTWLHVLPQSPDKISSLEESRRREKTRRVELLRSTTQIHQAPENGHPSRCRSDEHVDRSKEQEKDLREKDQMGETGTTRNCQRHWVYLSRRLTCGIPGKDSALTYLDSWHGSRCIGGTIPDPDLSWAYAFTARKRVAASTRRGTS